MRMAFLPWGIPGFREKEDKMADDVLRYRLEKNYRAILRDLEPGKVLPYLFQEGIFDLDDKDEVNAEKTRKKKAEVLLDKLQREGPRALEVLASALRQKQPHLAGILETPVPGETVFSIDRQMASVQAEFEGFHFEPGIPNQVNSPVEHCSSSPRSTGNTDKGSKMFYASEDQYWVRPSDLTLRDSFNEHPELVYPMNCSPHGFAILINIEKFEGSELEERVGAKKDEENVERLFQGLGYEVKSVYNHTKKGIVNGLQGIVDEIKCSKTAQDSVVVFLMSHGEDDFIYCSDGEKLAVDTVRELFSNDNCAKLAGKPKLIFIQACRGKLRDRGRICADGGPTETTDEPLIENEQAPEVKGKMHFDAPKPIIPSGADMLVAFSSVSGYASFRNTTEGSRFVRKLVEIFRKNACGQDVLSMMTMVNNEVSKMGDFGNKQVPQPSTTLRKKVYFWPSLTVDH